MSDLLNAFRYHRSARNTWQGRPRAIPAAATALQRARDDMATGVARYASSPWAGRYGAVSWQPKDNPRSRERIGYVEEPTRAGLRLVGRVMPDAGGRSGYWDDRESCGYYTDAYGDVFKDGTGLCYGLVYQLPGRDGKARFVAGYQYGGQEGGPMVDFGTVFEEDARGGYNDNPRDYEAARDAARAADCMAEKAAEQEREYNTAWAAGNQYSDCLEELATIRQSVLATIRDMKGACKTLAALPDTLRARLRQSIESELSERESIFAKMAKLARGDYDGLIFYPDDRLKSAFNEGAGKTVLR